jgi:hypothetical protein
MNSHKVVAWDPETTELGLGIDWNSQKTFECPFDMFEEISSGLTGFEAKFHAEQVESSKDICTQMDVGVEASMKADIGSYGIGISANAKMANSLTKKRNIKTLIATCKVEFESKTVDHRSGLWKRLAVDPGRYTEKEFYELFGDAYFYMVTKGSACYIMVSVQENEKNSTEDINAALSATVNSINVSGKIDIDVKRHLEAFERNSTMEINVLIIGAEATAITLDLQGLLDYASTFLVNVNKKTAVPIHGTIRKYTDLAGYGGFKSGAPRIVVDKTKEYERIVDGYYIVVDKLQVLDDMVNNPSNYCIGNISEGRELKEWYMTTWQSHHRALQEYVTDCASFIMNPSQQVVRGRPVGWEYLPLPQPKLSTFARIDTKFLNRTPDGDVAKPRTLIMGMLLPLDYPEAIGHRVRYSGKKKSVQPISIYAKARDDQAVLGVYDDKSLEKGVTFVTHGLAVHFDSKDYIVASNP